MDLLIFEKFAVISINVLAIFLGISVFLANKKSKKQFLFFLTTIIMLLWIDSSFLLNYSTENQLVFLSGKINLATFSLFCATIYLFIKNFPHDSTRFSIKDFFVAITGFLLFSVTLFSNIVVKSISIDGTERKWTLNYGEWLVYFYSIVIAILIITDLYKKYKTPNKNEKSKIMYFFVSAVTFVSLNIIFNIIVPAILGNDSYYFIGDYSIILFLVLIAVAITKNSLFNIKIIAVQSTVILISLALLIETILSTSLSQGIIQSLIWVLATYGGYILIKSVKVEIKQKEDLQKLSKKLDEANSHLEELGEAKDNFLSMAAHELNTPIAAIEGYLSMIIEEKMAGEINPKATGYLQNIFKSSKRLAGLVKDLLNVSRIESNRVHLIYTEEHIEDVIDQSISEVKIKADEVGHKLIFDKPKTVLPKTWFDVDRITEVIINMVGNAIKYTEPPGKIVVSAHTDGDKIVVSVEDNGRGIPKDKYDHVFEKFVQVNVLTDQVKGTGLGMFISKNLVEMHKGKVWFKSSVDEKEHGTTFFFSLPILKDKPFDPHEGEGALFQTGQKQQKRMADVTDKQTDPNDPTSLRQVTGSAGQADKQNVADIKKSTESKPDSDKEAEKQITPEEPKTDTKITDPTAIPVEVKEEKAEKQTESRPESVGKEKVAKEETEDKSKP